MAMKKTDLFKSLALLTAQRMKNSTKTPKPGAAEANAKTKKELASANPLLASLMKAQAEPRLAKVMPKKKAALKTSAKSSAKSKAK
ncbi:hypothetical protein [Polynucleobacter necessarius]|uniref:hypothetical protein n=1 Tax=Polynucleobacter necessarius TaxID=576610 RepID=UPI000E095B3D|nr:hypothetical protein [Polynucleobacter necessarius]